MARINIDNGQPASTIREALNSNFTELYNSVVPKNHASTGTTYGVGSTTNYGHVKVTSGNGLNINNGVISMDKGSTLGYGAIKVTSGNGLIVGNGVLSMALGTTSGAGAVQLVNNHSTNDSGKAATAAALKAVWDGMVVTFAGTGDPSSSTGKNGDIYVKI